MPNLKLYEALSPDDFTKKGESIPKEGGLTNFVKYNIAHIDPIKLALQMGMASGGIKSINTPSASLYEALSSDATEAAGPSADAIRQADQTDQALGASKEARDSLDRFLGTAQTYGGIPPKPQMSIGPLKQTDNLARITK